MAGRHSRPRRLYSLRRSTALLLVFCWIVPYILVVAVSGSVSQANNRRHVEDAVTSTVESAVESLQREFDGLVSESLNASYVPVIRGAYLDYGADGRTSELYTTLREFLSYSYARNYRVRAAFLVLSELPVTATTDYIYTYNPLLSRYSDALDFYRGGAAAHSMALIGTLGSGIHLFELDGHYYMARVLSLQESRYEPYAALVLEIDMNGVLDAVDNLSWIIDATLRVGDLEVFFTGESVAARDGLWDNTLLVTGVSSGARLDIVYSIRVDLGPLLREGRTSLVLLLSLVLVSLPVLWLFYRFFRRKIDRPIGRLRGFTHEIEEGGFGNQIDTATLESTEFEALGANLNAMSARLEYQFERIYREELALRDARIKALQSHINPHFLGNTLELINWEARLSGDVKASRMLEALSTLMAAATDRSGQPLVPLSEEMAYVAAYLYIIGERLGKRLKVVQEIDADLLDWTVPRLILQPIVENAVEHGADARNKRVITIRARRVDADWMVLEVENNSPLSPRDAARIAQLLGGDTAPDDTDGRIGIHNVDLRLRILYGERSGLRIQGTENGTTLSSLRIGRTGDGPRPAHRQ